MFEPASTGLDHALVICDLTQILVVDGTDMPQFRGGNPYFLSENLYQSVSVTNASMYPRHFARDSHSDAVCTKIPILRNKIKITNLLLS